MNNLESKLREILDTYRDHIEDSFYGQPISEIKQAFIDEGYAKLGRIRDKDELAKAIMEPGAYILPGYMTGQEWYDRFEKELKEYRLSFIARHKAHLAARTAAGIE